MNRGAILGLTLLALGSPAYAQDEPRFALVASFPAPTVSFQWEINDKFAFRIDGSYSYRDQSTDDSQAVVSSSTSGGTSSTVLEQRTHLESSTKTTSVAFAGIVTFRKDDHLRLYIAPRLVLGFTDQATSTTRRLVGTLPQGITFIPPYNLEPESFAQEDSYSSTGGGLSVGAASNVFQRVALFGEIGATYTHSDGPTAIVVPTVSTISMNLRGESDTSIKTFSTRAVAGIMFRF